MSIYFKRITVSVLALAAALTIAIAFAPLAHAAPATTDQGDMGSYTLDLTKGDKVLPVTTKTEGQTAIDYGDGMLVVICLSAAEQFDQTVSIKEADSKTVDIDLDKDGSFDLRVIIDDLDNPENITFRKLDTSSITYSKTVSISENAKAKIVENDEEKYFSSVTVVFNPPAEKAANTLVVKGKTAKVSQAKLTKKSIKLKVKKVLKVSKAKGKVTYKKIKGNKGIKINKKTGKVTVKKGLKKGLYKIKVAVKAAGNKEFKPTTKKVTFKIKVK